MAPLALAFLAGCATAPREHIIRAWDFEPRSAGAPEGQFTRVTDRIDGAPANVASGNHVDDVFFFLHGAGPEARLWADDVVLFSPTPRSSRR